MDQKRDDRTPPKTRVNGVVRQQHLIFYLYFPDAQSYRQKKSAIKWIVNSADPDLDNLRQLAISRGGLLNDEIRKKAWPKLLNIDVENISPKPGIV